MHRMRHHMWHHAAALACTLGLALGGAAQAAAPEPQPTPAPTPNPSSEPLQTKPSDDDAWILDGWTAAIRGIGGEGKTLLVVNGEEGYRSIIELDGQTIEKTHPAVFELADTDHRIPLKVIDARGATWSETIDVPKAMKITVEIRAQYLQRGYAGTIKNDTLACKKAGQRKRLKFEVFQGETQIGTFIELDPGKSAPGVRLKLGTYAIRIYDPAGADWTLRRTVPLEVKGAWRFDQGCE